MLCGALVGAGALVAVLSGAARVALIAPTIIAVCLASTIGDRWRFRRERAALRPARRRAATAYRPRELRTMCANSAADLQDLVHSRCEAADRQGRALLTEVDEDDQMAPAWRAEGFKEAEGVDTHWGHVALLDRRPRSRHQHPR